jgi:hypothetical protein
MPEKKSKLVKKSFNNIIIIVIYSLILERKDNNKEVSVRSSRILRQDIKRQKSHTNLRLSIIIQPIKI